jgi:hypothetical protein
LALQPSPFLIRFPLISPKLLHLFERKASVSEPLCFAFFLIDSIGHMNDSLSRCGYGTEINFVNNSLGAFRDGCIGELNQLGFSDPSLWVGPRKTTGGLSQVAEK